MSNAKAIKAALAKTNGKKQAAIAKEHGVSRGLVQDIWSGRVHKDAPWPKGFKPTMRANGMTLDAEMELKIAQSEVETLKLELQRERAKSKKAALNGGLFQACAAEISGLKPFSPRAVKVSKRKYDVVEDLVMHLSDGHHDQVVTPEECGGLETYDFEISCARAETYVDTVLRWSQSTLENFRFENLWVLAYGDHTSGEIHGHADRSVFRNMFKNCLAIGQLHASMLLDLAPYFEQVNVIYVPGNHGRRSPSKNFNTPQDNWDYLVAKTAQTFCRQQNNLQFIIPNSYTINLTIRGHIFHICHGDDIRGSLGIPHYGIQRRQKALVALGSVDPSHAVRYFVMGHHHTMSSLADVKGEMVVNGAWLGTDAYSYNSFAGYRDPMQLLHGVHDENGMSWRLPVKMKGKERPERYLIEP